MDELYTRDVYRGYKIRAKYEGQGSLNNINVLNGYAVVHLKWLCTSLVARNPIFGSHQRFLSLHSAGYQSQNL